MTAFWEQKPSEQPIEDLRRVLEMREKLEKAGGVTGAEPARRAS